MNTRLWIFSLAFSLLAIAACNNEPDIKGTLIRGTIDNAANMQTFLDYAGASNSISVMGKTTTDAEGSFEISMEAGAEPGIYRLRFGTKQMFFILDGTEKLVTMKGDLASIDQYDVEFEGSDAASSYVDNMAKLQSGNLSNQQKKELVQNAEHPLVAMNLAMAALPPTESNLPIFLEISNNLDAAKYGNEIKSQYASYIAKVQARVRREKATQKVQVGEMAPEITLPNPQGKEMSLSDLRGKIVLLDFWASWCGPCRRANPHVVEIYKKYKDQGFTVFSVSLDGLDSRTRARYPSEEALQKQLERHKERWVDAIEKDNLEWKYHVSDLKKWECEPAGEYGVRGIPRTYLIDREGKIAAVNPRTNLEEELKKLL